MKVFRLTTSADKVSDMVRASRTHDNNVKRLAHAFKVDLKRLCCTTPAYAMRVCRQQPSGMLPYTTRMGSCAEEYV